MKRAWIALVAVAVFAAVPASAMARHQGPAVKNAAKYCKQQRTQMGAAAFSAAYGGKKNAFGKCVKQRVHDQNALRRAAVQQCKTELGVQSNKLRNDGQPGDGSGTQAGDGSGDQSGDGPGNNQGNHGAFKKCVKSKVQQQDQNNQQDFISAVRSCLTEHDADPAAFNTKYGDGGNDREAFVHCVRLQFQQNQGDDNDGDDQGDDNQGDDNGDQSGSGDSNSGDSQPGTTQPSHV